jgi:hypothetical protein
LLISDTGVVAARGEGKAKLEERKKVWGSGEKGLLRRAAIVENRVESNQQQVMRLPLSEWRRKRRKRKASLKSLTSISEVAEEDIFIVGYPKSGNTWFQDLVTAVIYGVHPAYAPPSLAQALVPDVHRQAYYQRFATPMFFKSHHLPRPEYKRVVYLIRDGRDVMVSFYHYEQATKAKGTDLLEMVQAGPEIKQGKWHAHIEAWLANPFGAQMMTIKYEDLKGDTVTELERFCDFAGVKRERGFLEMMAEEAQFEKMQEREMQKGSGVAHWPKDKLFRRRGVVGSYKDEMSAEALEQFMGEAGETLRRCGYA